LEELIGRRGWSKIDSTVVLALGWKRRGRSSSDRSIVWRGSSGASGSCAVAAVGTAGG